MNNEIKLQYFILIISFLSGLIWGFNIFHTAPIRHQNIIEVHYLPYKPMAWCDENGICHLSNTGMPFETKE